MRQLLFIVVLLLSAPAQAQELTIDLAQERVDITTGFDGTNIIVYGVKEGPGEVALTLMGPERTMVVRRKGQVLGAWINVGSVEFHRVPGYYDFAQSGAVDEAMAQKYNIGLGALDFYHEERLSEDDERRFRDALIRNKQQQGLFPLQGRAVQTIGEGLFKTVFPVPANVPSGPYRLYAYVFNGASLSASAEKTLQVGQVGFSASVYVFAHEKRLLYGVTAVLLALSAGWGAFTFLRRD